ncbi:MAG: DUF3783 domain-containing protein [Bacteroidales bacterium]|nr:DUF3783 domain-containing protein [Bacteroidales bacterium]
MSFQKVNLEDTIRSSEKTSVMAYGYDENEMKILQKYCDEQSIDHLIRVNDAMIDLSLENILQITKESACPSALLPVRAVIMNGFSGNDLQGFLKNFKNTGLDRPIFATVTPISKQWTFKALINELIKEHEIMKNRRKNK